MNHVSVQDVDERKIHYISLQCLQPIRSVLTRARQEVFKNVCLKSTQFVTHKYVSDLLL